MTCCYNSRQLICNCCNFHTLAQQCSVASYPPHPPTMQVTTAQWRRPRWILASFCSNPLILLCRLMSRLISSQMQWPYFSCLNMAYLLACHIDGECALIWECCHMTIMWSWFSISPCRWQHWYAWVMAPGISLCRWQYWMMGYAVKALD